MYTGENFNPFEVIVKYSGDISDIDRELQSETEILGNGIAIITFQSPEDFSTLYSYDQIEYIETPKNIVFTVNENFRISCIPDSQNPAGHGLTGKGVLIGVIDSGIDYTHPDFQNSDKTSKILYIWDQTETFNSNPPAGFKTGTEYTQSDINKALKSNDPFAIVKSTDFLGHGTAVSGVCSGNRHGVAPESSLIIVKLGYRGYESFARTTEIMRALKYIVDRAETLRMPVAVNISLGTNNSPHDGKSLFESYIDFISLRWKTVIISAAGNEGAAGHHFSDKINTGETSYADFIISETVSSVYLTLWKNFSDDFSFELISPSGISTGKISKNQRLSLAYIQNTKIQSYYGQPSPYSMNQEIFFQINGENERIPYGIWRVIIESSKSVDGRFDIWLPTIEEVGLGVSFANPSLNTTLTSPSSAESVISVAGYNGNFDTAAAFSGRGFNRSGYIKPDISAPAVRIASSRTGGGAGIYTGTSMAAPFVTGAAAIIMQWGVADGNDPFLYGQRVKAFLIKGARQNSREVYPSNIWGYGALCLRDSINELLFHF